MLSIFSFLDQMLKGIADKGRKLAERFTQAGLPPAV
jgi:hypothetical protein